MNYSSEETFDINGQDVTAYKVSHDSNGNPRWVVHFLDLLTRAERDEAHAEANARSVLTFGTEVMMEKALAKAHKVGGIKYRAKWFGGGIVFQSYNIKSDIAQAMA
jgi:hypothetical protein